MKDYRRSIIEVVWHVSVVLICQRCMARLITNNREVRMLVGTFAVAGLGWHCYVEVQGRRHVV